MKHEYKRGSSHSYHNGGGNRTAFKPNTGGYENLGVQLNNGPDLIGPIMKPGQGPNARLMSFDSHNHEGR